ncbi:unnamed protein product [Schistocephalus solidus]|uniref:Clathrin_bdg domain-containing protein n=1 Tax=Schistocephalus solidus TaxID=70667 RepID=A0A183TK39_SCHSO|nr:unnamed protein product [Schistocephalus solidus]
MQTSSPPNRTQSADNLHDPHNLFSEVISHGGIEQMTEQSIESFAPHAMSTSFLDADTDQEHNPASIGDGSLLRWVPRDNPPVMQGVYAPPSIPVSDDFIDLDVYPGSVNTSDEEQGASENDIYSLTSFQNNSREDTDMDLHFQSISHHPDPETVASASLHPARELVPLASTSNRWHNENRLAQWNSFGQPSDPWGIYSGEVVSSSPPSMLSLRRANPEQDTGSLSTVGDRPVETHQMTGRICASSPTLELAPVCSSFSASSSSSSSSSGRDRASSPAPSTSSPSLSDGLGRDVRPPSIPQPFEATERQPHQPAFSDVGCMDVQLMTLSDVASGSSMTCTLVNLLLIYHTARLGGTTFDRRVRRCPPPPPEPVICLMWERAHWLTGRRTRLRAPRRDLTLITHTPGLTKPGYMEEPSPSDSQSSGQPLNAQHTLG